MILKDLKYGIWRGKHDLNEVWKKLEKCIDSQEKFIDTSLKILPKTS